MEKRNRVPVPLFSLLVMLQVCDLATAQTSPETGYMFPPAVQAGTTSELQIGGFDFTPDMQFFVQPSDIQLETTGELSDFIVPPPPYWFGPKSRTTAFPIPRELSATISVPADTKRGFARWQVANVNGASKVATFFVSGMLETVEERWRNEPQILDSVPIAVSGRISRIAEVDRYQFKSPGEGAITLDLMARRIGSDFNAIIQVRDSTGILVADLADTQGHDITHTFSAKANQTYTVSVFDLDFRGNQAFVYRLSIKPGSRVIATIPAYARRGHSREFTLIGYGLNDNKPGLQTAVRNIDINEEADRFFDYQFETTSGKASWLFPLGDLTEFTEDELTTNSNEKLLPINSAVTARLNDSQSTFIFEAKKETAYRLTAQSEAVGSNLDVSIDIYDQDGKVLAGNDDLPGTLDAGADFKPTEDGFYQCIVSDSSGNRNDPKAIYRLSLEEIKAGFELTASAQFIHVPIGGSADLTIKVNRSSGFAQPIKLRFDGLAKDVTLPDDLTIPADKKELKIPIKLPETASSSATEFRVIGSAMLNSESVERFAVAEIKGRLCPNRFDPTRTTDLLLVPKMTAPFSLLLVDRNRQRAVNRGTTYPAPFVIERNEGFSGEVVLQMASKQGRHRQGIDAPELIVPSDATEVLYPCFMPEWLETDRTTRMVVQAVGQVADPAGKMRYVNKAADARVTMILEGAILKLSHDAHELTVATGEKFEIPVEVFTTPELNETVSVELIKPSGIVHLLDADRLNLPSQQQTGSIEITTKSDSLLVGDWEFTLRATAMRDGKWPVVSETIVPVRFISSQSETNSISSASK